MKRFVLLCLVTASLFSCDVRRRDKLADDTQQKIEQALKDSTTVQLIDTTYYFGTITEGESITYNFRFKNTGNKPLIINNASASCGCTVPEKPEKPVMPGETGFLKVVFNSRGKSGHQEKAIIVSANAKPFFPEFKLTGEVKQKQ